MRRVPSGAGEDVDVDADALLGDGQRPFLGTIARIAGARAALRQHRARFGADLRLDRLAAPVGHPFALGNPPFPVAFYIRRATCRLKVLSTCYVCWFSSHKQKK